MADSAKSWKKRVFCATKTTCLNNGRCFCHEKSRDSFNSGRNFSFRSQNDPEVSFVDSHYRCLSRFFPVMLVTTYNCEHNVCTGRPPEKLQEICFCARRGSNVLPDCRRAITAVLSIYEAPLSLDQCARCAPGGIRRALSYILEKLRTARPAHVQCFAELFQCSLQIACCHYTAAKADSQRLGAHIPVRRVHRQEL